MTWVISSEYLMRKFSMKAYHILFMLYKRAVDKWINWCSFYGSAASITKITRRILISLVAECVPLK